MRWATALQQVPRHAELDFVDLGSGIGKMVLAAAAVFRSAAGYEIAPERAAVAAAALARLGADGAATGCCSRSLYATCLCAALTRATQQRRQTRASCVATS